MNDELCTTFTIKGTVLPRTGHNEPEWEKRYGYTLSLTSAPDEGGCSTPHPRKETWYPLYRRVGGPQDHKLTTGMSKPKLYLQHTTYGRGKMPRQGNKKMARQGNKKMSRF